MTPPVDPSTLTPVGAVLVALPKILDLIARAETALKSEAYQSWMNNLDATVQALENAKTDQERFLAAKNLAALTAHTG